MPKYFKLFFIDWNRVNENMFETSRPKFNIFFFELSLSRTNDYRNHRLRNKRYRVQRHRGWDLGVAGGGGVRRRRRMQRYFPKTTGECRAPAAHSACPRILPPRPTRVQVHTQSDPAHQHYRIAQMNPYVSVVIRNKECNKEGYAYLRVRSSNVAI